MKEETFDQLQKRIPERIIEHAVRGMLPKGRVRHHLLELLSSQFHQVFLTLSQPTWVYICSYPYFWSISNTYLKMGILVLFHYTSLLCIIPQLYIPCSWKYSL